MLPFLRRAAALAVLIAATLAPGPAPAQNEPQSLGTVRPQPQTVPTVIAVAPFGIDGTAPVEFETMPRIIRRDLELTGFFTMAPDQRWVNAQNQLDVRNRTVNFDEWRAKGIKHYVMGSVSMPTPDTLNVLTFLYDIDTGSSIIRRNISGPAGDVRGLAHRISDEIVKMTKFCDGIAQTELLFVTEQVPGVKEIALMDADGFNIRQLTRYGTISSFPCWGANGTEIYYTSYKGNRANIYGQLLSSGKAWPIAAYGGTNHKPEWSAAAQRLVMVLSKDGNSEIYSAARDGQGLNRLTKTTFTEGSPAWSPDGRRVCYASNEAGGVHLFVANADGSGKKRLTTRGSWNDAPTWSPDGSRIAFVSRNSGVFDIFTLSADGDPSSYRRLTMNQGDNESPCWAPNGRHLAFASNRTGQWQVYMMLDDGTNQRPLTSGGRNSQPKWGPLPAAQP